MVYRPNEGSDELHGFREIQKGQQVSFQFQLGAQSLILCCGDNSGIAHIRSVGSTLRLTPHDAAPVDIDFVQLQLRSPRTAIILFFHFGRSPSYEGGSPEGVYHIPVPVSNNRVSSNHVICMLRIAPDSDVADVALTDMESRNGTWFVVE